MAAQGIDPRRLLLASAVGLTLWVGATFLWHVTWGTGMTLAVMLLLDQDFPALLIGILALVLLTPLGVGGSWKLPPPTARTVLPLVVLFALAAWAGHYLLFQDYALSRDEEVARFAAAYLKDGMLARPIPPEWQLYRRAIMPEFFAPYGVGHYWAAAYLPINSAIQAVFWRLGDPNLAQPALLMGGLIALWRIALRLFPDRPDAVWAALLLGFTSTQLWVTAMTPYAMTGHFALNLLWLALVLRGGWAGHAGAGIVAIFAAGLHQWHFPPIFIAPFILWMLLARRWGAAAFHIAVLVAIVVIWAKLWPALLLDQLGPPADVRPSAGVVDKVGSLFGRLADKWQPLISLTRFAAWNNLLLAPLALVGMATIDWRRAIRGQDIALPLALASIVGCSLALAQGYGWGFRYAHGLIGPLCLLGGLGYLRLRTGHGMRLLWLSCGVALMTAGFLVWRTHVFVAPYAASHRMIRDSGADVVLIDPRGGLFVTDLVRGANGVPGDPMVMNLGMLRMEQVEQLCADYSVALFDRTEFRRVGVPLARWNYSRTDALRRRMDRLGCERRVF
ncbi:MFS transporter [Sphingobium sp. AN641]|uniref:MFS transporter n=1 Tax=Sphingobium sp. AN641 TaxID=3133443 RepID=UPI0030C5AFD7